MLREELQTAIENKTGGWLGGQMFLVLLYPFALLQIVLFWIRFARHEYLRAQNVMIVAVHFFVLTFFSVIGLIVAAFQDVWGFTMVDFVILGVIFLVVGLMAVGISGSIEKRKLDLLERYHALASEGRYTHVSQIAAQTGRSVAAASLALNFMYDAGLLPYYAHQETGELLYDESYDDAEAEDEDDEDEDGEAEVEVIYEDEDDGPLTVECPGCGSKAQIYRHQPASCEYCGTPLSWPSRVS